MNKICKGCNRDLPEECFRIDKRIKRGGRVATCKACYSSREGRNPRTVPPDVKLTEAQAAYLAGLIDGEGCLCVYKVPSKCRYGVQYNAQLSVKMNADFVMSLPEEFAVGRVRRYRSPSMAANWKGMCEWTVGQMGMRAILPQIRPYLRHKGPQADLVVEFLGLASKHTTQEKAAIYRQMRELNRRGIDPSAG